MPVTFTPEEKLKNIDAPYFEDVTGDAGFRGYSTQKSEEQLISEVTSALSRLGGMLTGFTKGKWMDAKKRTRFIYDITFGISGPGGIGNKLAKIQVAALPLRKWTEQKEKQARKQALYVLRDWLESTWNFQRINPMEVATLIPFMINKNGVTLSESYLTGQINLLLEEGNKKKQEQNEIIDVEIEE